MSTVNGLAPEDTIPEALAAGLLGIDASRRVGWAKAFERARRVEGLEEQVSGLQSELNELRLCYVRLVGFTDNLPVPLGGDAGTQSVFRAEMNLHKSAIRSYLNRRAYNSGRNEADKHRGLVRQWDEERLKLQEQKQDRHVAAWREDIRELIDKALRAGHDTQKQAQPDGSFSCSCSCGDNFATADEHEAYGWVARHRVTAVHGVDLKEYRKLRKGKRLRPQCMCALCGNVHGLIQDTEETP